MTDSHAPRLIIEAPALSQQVYAHLRSAILSGELAAGQRISPQTVARRLGVSLTPVRAALQLLEEDGLVESAPRRWTRVASPDVALAAQIYPVIAALEELAIQSIGRPLDDSTYAALLDTNARLKAASDVHDMIGCIDANDAFHDTIVHASRNEVLANVLAELKARVRLVDSEYFRFDTSRSFADHAEISAMLRAGDADRAASLMRSHWMAWLPSWRRASDEEDAPVAPASAPPFIGRRGRAAPDP